MFCSFYRVRIRNIEQITEFSLPILASDDCDSGGTCIDPTMHLLIPLLHVGTGGGIWSLCVD
ncbi:MAG: hypothetical protein KHY90_10155 [Clostridium sp.]|nr:hypothetical protein [Clostridium sp.]